MWPRSNETASALWLSKTEEKKERFLWRGKIFPGLPGFTEKIFRDTPERAKKAAAVPRSEKSVTY
jgi:hypothetical protein